MQKGKECEEWPVVRSVLSFFLRCAFFSLPLLLAHARFRYIYIIFTKTLKMLSGCAYHSDCPDGSVCDDFVCRPIGEDTLCSPKIMNWNGSDLYCPDSLSCDPTIHRCVYRAVKSNVCLNDKQCSVFHYCDEHECLPRVGIQSVCNTTSQCMQPLLCMNGVCSQPCIEDDNCWISHQVCRWSSAQSVDAASIAGRNVSYNQKICVWENAWAKRMRQEDLMILLLCILLPLFFVVMMTTLAVVMRKRRLARIKKAEKAIADKAAQYYGVSQPLPHS